MKKSILISDDPFFLDLSGSTRTVRASHLRRTSSNEQKDSRLFVSGINYPGSTFVAKKLKRIIETYIKSIFNKLKSNKKIIVNLNLLDKIAKRFLTCSFFAIKHYSQSHKG